jgi:hypothetical protein
MKTSFFLLLAALLLAGCSGVKTYPDLASKNVHVRTKLVEERMFGSIRADLDVYSVDAKCEAQYLGTLELDKASVDLGIPSGQQTYLVFVFSSKGMLGSAKGSTTYTTLLRPRAGFEYRADVRYVDDIYNVDLIETQPGKKSGRELEPRRLENCRS